MSRRGLKPITVGQLEMYLSNIKDKDTIVQVGFGESAHDANFLINNNGKLALYSVVYMASQEDNIINVLSLNKVL